MPRPAATSSVKRHSLLPEKKGAKIFIKGQTTISTGGRVPKRRIVERMKGKKKKNSTKSSLL